MSFLSRFIGNKKKGAVDGPAEDGSEERNDGDRRPGARVRSGNAEGMLEDTPPHGLGRDG